MIKFLVTGLILYFMYRFMFQPSLTEGQGKQNQQKQPEEDVIIRGNSKNPRDEGGDFIEYEEVE